MAKTALYTIIAVLVAGVVLVAGWQFGWWLTAKNTDRQVQIDNRNTGTQTAWHDQVLADARDLALLEPNDPRRGALVTEGCTLAARLTSPYRDDIVVAFTTENCP